MNAWSRLSSLCSVVMSPGHRRSVMIRRLLALVLAAAALVTGLMATRQHEPNVVAFKHDVKVGTRLTEGDLTMVYAPPSLLPSGALTRIGDAVGHTVVASAAAKEIVTNARITGPRLTQLLSDSFATDAEPSVVPVQLGDTALARVLRHGDTVTVVAPASKAGTTPNLGPDAGSSDRQERHTHAEVVAEGARVVSTDPESPETVLIVLPAPEAERVAAASLTTPLALTIAGTR